MNEPSLFLTDSLKRKVIFFTGKGGVGKTTLVWATALALSRHKKRVKVISFSSFEPDSTLQSLESLDIPWERLEAAACFKEYTLKTLKFEKIFDVVFENKILKAFIDVAPGLSDTVIAGKIWDLYDKAEQDTLIVDLPATGHALSFFKSPMGIEKMFATGFVHRQANSICRMFMDPYTRLDVVSLPEEMPMVESGQFIEQLSSLGTFPLGFLIVNQCTPDFPLPKTLPENIPGDVKQCVTDHQKRLAREHLALKHAQNIPLTLNQIPRIASEAVKDTVLQLANLLET